MFDKLYQELIKVLESKASEARKYEAVEEFAEIFINFDTSKLNKYFD